jgi:hypothetical protein
MTTATATPPRRQMPDAHPLGPALRHLAPADVERASEILAERQAALAEAAAKLREAQAEAEGAPQEDRLAAAAATEKGEKLPKAKAPAAQARLEAAQREHEARRDLTVAAADAYLAEVRANHSEIASTVVAELEHEAQATAEDFERIEAALTRIVTLRFYQRAVGENTDHLLGRNPSFVPQRMGRQAQRDPLKGQVRDALEALRAAVGL